MTDKDVIKKSVTKGDYAEDPRSGIINFMIPYWGDEQSGLPPVPPAYWSGARDFVLKQTLLQESMWADAVGIAVTKMASMSWEVTSDVPIRARRAQDLYVRSMDVKYLSKHLQDYLCTDNGTFTEIVRATRGKGSRIMGLVHLDSLRCTRTGDPDIPVIYRDKKSREHELKDYQVITMSDMPDPGETFFGVGKCAATRAYKAIYKLSVMDRYISEKIGGKRPLELHFVNSVSQRQLEGARAAAEQDSARQGFMTFMGAIVIPLLDANQQVSGYRVPLAEIPDGFNRKEEFDIAVLTYANAIGLDVQDIQPLTGQPLGSGQQSEILDEKGKGKGLVAWRQEFANEQNWEILDDRTTFAWNEEDMRDLERKANHSKILAETSSTRITSGITSPEQELQVLVDLEELPKEFLPEDRTPGDKLSEDEKPEEEGEGGSTPEEEIETETMTGEKSLLDIDVVMEEEHESAVELYESVVGD